MSNLYGDLHGLYPVSKTLRFELIPIGKTKENIEKNGILNDDEKRAIAFKKVKKYCDECHKKFIDEALKDFELNVDDLNEYYTTLNEIRMATKEEKRTNEFIKKRDRLDKIQEKLRKQISDRFTKSKEFKEIYKGLKGKELTEIYVEELYKNDKEKMKDIDEFKKFSTYFSGYRKNRENMYSADEKSTAIAYRIVNENLPIFISNMKIYRKAKEVIQDKISKVYEELNELIQVNNIDEMFELEYFNDTLTQTEIEIYNNIISGKSEENGRKVKGINEYINEYNQTRKNKNERIPKLKELYKQILSERKRTSFVIDKYNYDSDMIKEILEYYQGLLKIMNENNRENLIRLLKNINDYDLTKIYLNNDANLSEISNKVYGNWNVIKNSLELNYDESYSEKKKKDTEGYVEEREKYFKNKKCFSIAEIENAISKYNNEKDNKLIEYIQECKIDNENLVDNINEKYDNFKKVEIKYNNESNELLKKGRKNSKESKNKDNDIERVKDFLDTIKELQEFLQPLVVKDNAIEIDSRFYNEFLGYYDEIKEIIPIYNKTRNYLTQKPYSNEMIKLNFDNSTLLNGWDKNKEQDYCGVILLKDNKYYLGIIDKLAKKIFENYQINLTSKAKNYKKMEYKLLPTPNKMLPKVFFSEKGINYYHPSEEILRRYDKGEYKKGENFDLSFCHKLIDFYKEAINKNSDWNCFKFKFKDTEAYKDISEFYRDVEKQGYKIVLKDIDENYINKLIDNGQLYLFQIYNKDFSKYSKGKQNLHTLYWKELFDEENLKNIIYELNGGAEVFYRKRSLNIEETAHHKANVPIANKNPKTIERKPTSTFKYEIIKDRRYTVDKFQLHVPITLNFNNQGISNINEIVNKKIKENDENYIIGIDRGERNLIYVSLIDSKGEIIAGETKSLNTIENDYNKTDYHMLLDKKENEMNQARKSWRTIENIKELKEGYLSQAIHEIVVLMEKYNAIVVLEDLNSGFKNSRAKIGKQVYQKFEKMLIDKLNYLVFTDREKKVEGGVLNAYQLTNKFTSFKDMKKQNGILFYIPAWNTSKIDPTTGFVNLFNSSILEKTRELVENIDNIKYNQEKDYFEFDIDYSKYPCKLHNSKSKWTLCSNGERIITYRNPDKNNEWDYKEITLTKEFKKLFDRYDININGDIKKEILEKADSKFFKAIENQDKFWGFKYLFKYMLQMRNSNNSNGKEEEIRDYLISPVKNRNGKFFNTDERDPKLPQDADANGAYNIARKGLMVIEQIKNMNQDELKRARFNITEEDWLKFAQKGK